MPEECANPLLLKWLKEWMDEAQERNSKGFTVYKKAYQSVKACPLKFNHPTEAQQLNGLGPKLCDRLTEKLKVYCSQNGLPMPEKIQSKNGNKRDGPDADQFDSVNPTKKPRKVQPYVPKLRSGPYALIMALSTLDQESNQALSKTDLIEKAQPLCDSSFTVPVDTTKFFTAWNSMKTLETKELICIKGHPTKRYYLSDEGWEVALRMRAAEGLAKQPRIIFSNDNTVENSATLGPSSKPTAAVAAHRNLFSDDEDIVDIRSSPEPNEFLRSPPPQRATIQSRPNLQNLRTNPDDATFVLPPGSFDVQLVLDNREVRSKSDRDYISDELRKHSIVPVIRPLPLGDVLWIAKVNEAFTRQLKDANIGDDDEGNTEIILEHILERKRLDDLVGSIKDGRFHEQKFRLRKSGIKNVTYLIEDYSMSAERTERFGEAVESAIAGMQMISDIFVKQTSKLDDTILYLARMTKALKDLYEDKELNVVLSQNLEADSYLELLDCLRKKSPSKIYGTTFSAFGALCDKNDSMTLRDVFLKMLMCTRGITGDKAVEIQKIWPTPRALIEAFELQDGVNAKSGLISNRLGDAIPRKKVAKALSAKISEIWA